MPTPKIYLLDADNKVKTHSLSPDTMLGGTDTRADIVVNAPGLSGTLGTFLHIGPGWSYRHMGAGSCFVHTGTQTLQLSTAGISRVRGMGGSSAGGQDLAALKSGCVMTMGCAILYFDFREDTGTWARLAVSDSTPTLLSQDVSVPGHPAGQGAIVCKNGAFYLEARVPGVVKLRGQVINGTVPLGTQNVITLGQRLFFWNQGILHYLSPASMANPTTFRINSYGSGIRVRPTPTTDVVSGTASSPAPVASAPVSRVVRSGERKSPSPQKPPVSTPAPVVSPVKPVPKPPVKQPVKSGTTPHRGSGVAVPPVRQGSGGARRVRRVPGKDTLKISIQERSARTLLHKKVLLRDIVLDVHTGEMVLILGGSGAGKTTFMNAVMGYEPANGTVTFKGMDVYEEYEKMKYMIGFVPQQDLMRDSDTVYETLKNAGEMKLPSSTTPEALEAQVLRVLNLMGLEVEQDNLVKKLSGGQRKRLSIAQEYIGNPTLFFLDEPDSGLDGGMAKSLMEKLRSIADSQKIVMLISHQPDRTSELFDKVIVLAKGTKDNCGHLAFFGTVEETKAFFGVTALEQVVQKINRKDEGGAGLSDYFIDKYKKGRK